jgi:hypothetical protein
MPRSPREFPGNRKRSQFAAPPPKKLQFGPHGELTYETLKQANLTKAEEVRAIEMLKVQKAFVDILDDMSYPVDPEGHVHDLNAMGPTKIAIAWTLALCGFRKAGKRYIKKREFSAPGVYADAHTWVDVRSPDTAEEELQPHHRPDDHKLPPDTRRLAAQRDGAPGLKMPEMWHVSPKITYEEGCE